jgi:hypothetical protein
MIGAVWSRPGSLIRKQVQALHGASGGRRGVRPDARPPAPRETSGAVTWLLALALLPSCNDPVDHDFDTSVPVAAYAIDHPRVGFDEGHANRRTTRGPTSPFVDLLRTTATHDVERIQQRFTKESASFRVP